MSEELQRWSPVFLLLVLGHEYCAALALNCPGTGWF